MNVITFLVLCLGTSWAQETQNDVARTASQRADEISRAASARAQEINTAASQRANTVQYYQPPMYGGGYGGYGYNQGAMPLYQVKQEGVVAITQKVSNSKELFETSLDCLKTATKFLDKKEVAKFCKDLAKEALKTSKVIADQAAEATVRPPILTPRWGW